MVSTRSMSAAKKTDAQNLKIATTSTKKTRKQKPMEEEAIKHFPKTEFFRMSYREACLGHMSYPFGPPEEFEKFENLGREIWETLREDHKAFYLDLVQKREARKQAVRKMELGEKLTDKMEDEAFKEMDGAAYISFGSRLFKEEYKDKVDNKSYSKSKQFSKAMNAASLKWESMTFEEKAPYFPPIWWTK